MRRGSMLILVVASALAIALLGVAGRPAPAARPPQESAAPTQPIPAVRVDQEIVAIPQEVVQISDPVPAALKKPAEPVRTATRERAPAGQRHASVLQPTLAARAKRAVLGDGRHRPQPFPRVN